MNTPKLPLLATLLTAAGVFASCEILSVPPPEELGLWSDAGAGVDDPILSDVCERVWENELKDDPFRATYLGDPRYLGRVPSNGPSARRDRVARQRAFLTSTHSIPTRKLSERDLLTRELLIQRLEGSIARTELGMDDWTVDPLAGPHVVMLNLASAQPHRTPKQRAAVVKRWNAFGGFLRQAGANLLRGRRKGLLASRSTVEKSIQQLDSILATSTFDSPLVEIATGGGEWITLEPGGNVARLAHEYLGDAREQKRLHEINRHLSEGRRIGIGTRVLVPARDDALEPGERGAFLYDVRVAVEEVVYPELRAFRNILVKEILPLARSDDSAGLGSLAGGEDAYRTMIRFHTSLPLEECSPDAIHEFGLSEVARIRREISVLGQKELGISEVGAIQEQLRHSKELHFSTREEVANKATEALWRASAKMSAYFGRLPRAACNVVRIASFEEQDSTIAYYRQPAPDGSRPGQYFINTFAPETRPRYEAEVLAYHEAIPGHHLQIAIAQELEDIPLFRRHGGSTAFVEGWALYTERLADEMGLYTSDLDRLGVLSFDAWRASRLVVDTGIHAFGWSRERAIEYMYANTLLAHNNVENEIDRYIAWPGQALAYKIGQREILDLRATAQERLGAAFDHRVFHDRILENGALSLESLRGVMQRWLGV